MKPEEYETLTKLSKKLRRKAGQEFRKVGTEVTRIEGMHKGFYLGLMEAHCALDKILSKAKVEDGVS